MALNFRIDKKQGVILSRFEGEITVELLEDYFARVRADPAFHPGLVELVEMGKVKAAGFSFPVISGLGKRFRALDPVKRVAVVTDSTLIYGLARMFQVVTSDETFDFQAFRSKAAAWKWLGLPE